MHMMKWLNLSYLAKTLDFAQNAAPISLDFQNGFA